MKRCLVGALNQCLGSLGCKNNPLKSMACIYDIYIYKMCIDLLCIPVCWVFSSTNISFKWWLVQPLLMWCFFLQETSIANPVYIVTSPNGLVKIRKEESTSVKFRLEKYDQHFQGWSSCNVFCCNWLNGMITPKLFFSVVGFPGFFCVAFLLHWLEGCVFSEWTVVMSSDLLSQGNPPQHGPSKKCSVEK